ncbi:hypothetical protein IFM89_037013 [Coptis chinensis]|uniref:protein-serine/threonine phosphatase n=1 Tax=Coptis chinensis TaxID=261450 RepID=A0A835LSS5_9MAGN|nr:hypothetical protein IFM89_037013 [Coptis chinensis]
MALGCNSQTWSKTSSWLTLTSSKPKYRSMHSNSYSKAISNGLAALLEEEESPEKSEINSPKEEVAPMAVDGLFLKSEKHSHENYSVMMKVGLDNSAEAEIGEVKVSSKIKRRPARLVVPESCPALEMQAYFGVFDGHGGSAAVNYVAENLGNNIITALQEFEEANDQSKEAIRKGYLVTDEKFLSQDVSSGACAATVLVKDGELRVANVGDCRVVLSRNGVATALTSDHRLDREDERLRIESVGGYVSCQNGVWRVQGSLAVSRAIGDSHLKQWVISEPEIKRIELTSDCDFLVLASDGLWDKVGNQEAVDMVLRHESYIESCKKLVDISSSRGNKDDITVMVVDLKNFKRRRG